MQEGLHAWATRGSENSLAGTGGAKRSGGLTAKGMPRNLFTVTVADGRTVVVPMTSPTSMVTVGLCVGLGACGCPSDITLIAATDDTWGWPSEIVCTTAADVGACGCPLRGIVSDE